MFVLDDPAKLDRILDAWDKIGIHGVTIVESTGLQRRRVQRKRIPMRFSLDPISVGGEEGNYTLITIVPSEEVIENCLKATEEIVGDLNNPNTGILVAWPLSFVKGVPLLSVD
jgi:nitrogen regulatory protein PII